MGRPISLRPRLLAIAERIVPHARVVDVGVDHARLPVYLAQQNITRRVVATDISGGPLARAAKMLELHRLLQEIALVQCDGLSAIIPEEVDTVVVAGMGGESIAEILRKAPWTKDKHLLLQPMTRVDRLLAFLGENAYALPVRTEISEGRRVYQMIEVGRENL